jgi:hypothetical protein
MIKQVTCALSTIRRAATAKGISLSVDDWCQGAEPDVHARTLKDGTVAVRGETLAGDLFLSLLCTGAL